MHEFRSAIEAKDVDALAELLADDVVFRSPVVFAPYHGRDTVIGILRMVARVFEDFRYTHELSGDDERSHALVFKTRVGERELEGCDFLHIGEDGRIDEFFVMVRPLSAAHALAEAMQAQLAEAQAARPA